MEAVACNQESSGSNHTFATISKFGHFCSLHGCFLMYILTICVVNVKHGYLFIYDKYFWVKQKSAFVFLVFDQNLMTFLSFHAICFEQRNQCLLCCSNPTMRAATSFNQSAISNILPGCCNFYRHDLLCQS